MGWVVPQVVQFAGHWGIGGSWQDRHWQGTETGQWVEMMPGTVWFWCRFFHNSLIRFSIFTQYRILCPWQTSETARQATSAIVQARTRKMIVPKCLNLSTDIRIVADSQDFVKCNYDFDMYWLLIGYWLVVSSSFIFWLVVWNIFYFPQ